MNQEYLRPIASYLLRYQLCIFNKVVLIQLSWIEVIIQKLTSANDILFHFQKHLIAPAADFLLFFF